MKTFRCLCAAAILAASTSLASADTRVLFAELVGGNELPALGDLDSFGSATVTLITPTALCYSIVLQNAGAASAAHIHTGAAGTAGPITVPLAVNALVPFRITNCIAVAAATITNIRNNPAGFYVNVHTAAFPAGAARGQLHSR